IHHFAAGVEAEDTLMNAVFEPGSEVMDIKHGLTLAGRYTRMLGGTIELEHRTGGITALMLKLPCQELADDDTQTEEDEVENQAGAA
ncbi:MAG: hypothetical protein OES84_06105, partial [Kiritimatiellaceae bacterium]|nr:hypothetical protein [Kiritimatiellaceae bacterium]